MPKIIFDSSTLIALGNSCLYGVLVKLKERNPEIQFLIPEGVHSEVIDIGDRVMKFAWNASRIQRLIDNKIIDVVEITDIEGYKNMENAINGTFKSKHGNIELLQKGELECIILAKETKADALAIDELTTRLLIEKPQAIKHLMETRYKADIMMDSFKLKAYNDLIKDIKVVRSIDIIALAHDFGLFDEYPRQNILKAMLYSLKYGGCAATFEEIDSYCINKGEFK